LAPLDLAKKIPWSGRTAQGPPFLHPTNSALTGREESIFLSEYHGDVTGHLIQTAAAAAEGAATERNR